MKISIIGAGFVGATTAFCIASRNIGDVVLVDIIESVKGKALDMLEAMPNLKSDSKITGTTDYSKIKDSNIIVITAGFPRNPGMTREDLIEKNSGIMEDVCKNIKKHAPDSIVIVVTNPLDLMCHLALEKTGFDKKRVVGMAGMLDTARFRTFLSQELNVPVNDVKAMVMGSHGDTMVPVLEHTSIHGVPVKEKLSSEKLKELVERTRNGGIEIINHLGKGSAYYAPATSITEMVNAISKDTKEVIPCSVYLEREYGYKGIYLGVPVRLGKEGAEEIVELELEKTTKEELDRSAKTIKENMS